MTADGFSSFADKWGADHSVKKFILPPVPCNRGDVWAPSRGAQLSTFLTHRYTRGSIVDTGELCGHTFSLLINIKAQPPSLTFTAKGSAGRRNNSQWNEEDGIDSLEISQSPWSTITFTPLIYLKPKDKLQSARSVASPDPSRVVSNALFSPDLIVYRALMVDRVFLFWFLSSWCP